MRTISFTHMKPIATKNFNYKPMLEDQGQLSRLKFQNKLRNQKQRHRKINWKQDIFLTWYSHWTRWYLIEIVIKSTRIIIKYARRAFCLHKTHQIEIFIKPNKYKVEKHWESKIPKSCTKIWLMISIPGIRKSWDFQKIQCFINRKFIKMTTWLIFMSTPKCWLLGWWYRRGRNVHQQCHRPSGLNSYQKYQDYN